MTKPKGRNFKERTDKLVHERTRKELRKAKKAKAKVAKKK